eukprot:TRINITY_DN21406_c0_g2_i1.p1 TRINITY_DN21406_c0_g2~~TRINITY_DN21406_c0_g2_i1.p1  ORF type:complete len:1208 (+),score=82.12 TRINITY_DN21406_c0_g2_i1:205-3624(+)
MCLSPSCSCACVPATESPTAPSASPTGAPSASPSLSPLQPTASPTIAPTLSPSGSPSASPIQPSASPSRPPTASPTTAPTAPPLRPTGSPSTAPTTTPSRSPSAPPRQPTRSPSESPTSVPSVSPSASPLNPTSSPTSPPLEPTASPSAPPSFGPSPLPTLQPSGLPSSSPTRLPSIAPTPIPTMLPSLSPSRQPSAAPTLAPSGIPSLSPSATPSEQPTTPPTPAPWHPPSASPTAAPSRSPSSSPSPSPSALPSKSPTAQPSSAPSRAPSAKPSVQPTSSPSRIPSTAPPTVAPSVAPTSRPSVTPTQLPSVSPTPGPTSRPSVPPTLAPHYPSVTPSLAPSSPPRIPTAMPSVPPELSPTEAPSTPPRPPSVSPTAPPYPPPIPTMRPSPEEPPPSAAPSLSPSRALPFVSTPPTHGPTGVPTSTPTVAPTESPSSSPLPAPTLSPTPAPPPPVLGTARDAAGGAVTTAVVAAGAAPAMSQLALAGDLTCSPVGTLAELPPAMHPTGITSMGSQYLGCLLGAALIMSSVTLLSNIALAVLTCFDPDGLGVLTRKAIQTSFLRYIPVIKDSEAVDLAAIARHPNIILFTGFFVYQGAAFSALRLLAGSRLEDGRASPWWMRLLGAVCAIVLIGLPAVLYRRVHDGVTPCLRRDMPGRGPDVRARVRPWDPPLPPRWLQYAFLSEVGDWVSRRRQKHWISRWQSAVRQYNERCAPHGAVLELGAMWLLGLANAWPTPSLAACGHVRLAAAAVHLAQLVYCLLYRPYRCSRDLVLQVARLVLLIGALAALAVAFYTAIGGREKPDTSVGSTLLTAATVIVLVKTLIIGISELVLLVKGYRANSQALEWGEQKEFEFDQTELDVTVGFDSPRSGLSPQSTPGSDDVYMQSIPETMASQHEASAAAITIKCLPRAATGSTRLQTSPSSRLLRRVRHSPSTPLHPLQPGDSTGLQSTVASGGSLGTLLDMLSPSLSTTSRVDPPRGTVSRVASRTVTVAASGGRPSSRPYANTAVGAPPANSSLGGVASARPVAAGGGVLSSGAAAPAAAAAAPAGASMGPRRVTIARRPPPAESALGILVGRPSAGRGLSPRAQSIYREPSAVIGARSAGSMFAMPSALSSVHGRSQRDGTPRSPTRSAGN